VVGMMIDDNHLGPQYRPNSRNLKPVPANNDTLSFDIPLGLSIALAHSIISFETVEYSHPYRMRKPDNRKILSRGIEDRAYGVDNVISTAIQKKCKPGLSKTMSRRAYGCMTITRQFQHLGLQLDQGLAEPENSYFYKNKYFVVELVPKRFVFGTSLGPKYLFLKYKKHTQVLFLYQK